MDAIQPYQQRVIEEKSELSAKLDKLELFIAGPVYTSLHSSERFRLSRQLLIMRLYEQVLIERIAAFSL